MEIKRTTEIFFEANRRFIIRQPESAAKVFCPACGSMMLAAEQIAALFSVSRRFVYQSIETGAAHFAETETGVVTVCLQSLETNLRGEAKQIADGKPPAEKGENFFQSEK